MLQVYMNTKGEKYIKKENKKAKSKSKYKEKNNTYHTKKKNRQLSLEKIQRQNSHCWGFAQSVLFVLKVR